MSCSRPTLRTKPIIEDALCAGDDNICTVVAYALVTGCGYAEAAKTLRERAGRRKRRGIYGTQLRHEIRRAGYSLEPYGVAFKTEAESKSFDKAKTALTLGQHLKKYGLKRTYLVHYSRHVGVFIDGVNHDWTSGRRNRPVEIYEVKLDLRHMERLGLNPRRNMRTRVRV